MAPRKTLVTHAAYFVFSKLTRFFSISSIVSSFTSGHFWSWTQRDRANIQIAKFVAKTGRYMIVPPMPALGREQDAQPRQLERLVLAPASRRSSRWAASPSWLPISR
jgi:hypothetical protein